MTQRYVIGELSALIGDLSRPDCSDFAVTLRDLRHRVESAAPWELAPLAVEALVVADAACWVLLERGEVSAFVREAADAAVLREFAVCAALLP